MLWFAAPGRPGCGLCFHEVFEKAGVTFRLEVNIVGFYRRGLLRLRGFDAVPEFGGEILRRS